jgi:hypothetical protein
MTYPPPSGGWNDPAGSGQQPGPPADPTLPVSSHPIPAQPTGADPYAPADPYAGGQPIPGQPTAADPYAAGYPQPGYPQPGYPQPGYPQPGYPQPGYPQPGYPGYGYPQPQKTNSLAIAALVLSLVGVASCITAPIGAILGHVAQKQIRQTGEGGEGMAKTAIIVGWILTGLLVLLIAFYVVVIVLAITTGDTSSSSY